MIKVVCHIKINSLLIVYFDKQGTLVEHFYPQTSSFLFMSRSIGSLNYPSALVWALSSGMSFTQDIVQMTALCASSIVPPVLQSLEEHRSVMEGELW